MNNATTAFQNAMYGMNSGYNMIERHKMQALVIALCLDAQPVLELSRLGISLDKLSPLRQIA